MTACSTPFWLRALWSCSWYGSLLSFTSSGSASSKYRCAESQLASGVGSAAPSGPGIGGEMFRYRLHSPDGDDLGEATYAQMIKPGEEIHVGAGSA